ncbi:MAG TPA: hypothetical protein VH988_32400 [Thermoanaerobaculia bacterium]|nr:hypothetical protein [Thermoanaerobaculia bacterium]
MNAPQTSTLIGYLGKDRETPPSRRYALVVYPVPIRIEIDLVESRAFRLVEDLTPPWRALAGEDEPELTASEQQAALDIAAQSTLWHPRRPEPSFPQPLHQPSTAPTVPDHQSSPDRGHRRAHVLLTVVVELVVDLIAGRVDLVDIDATGPIRAVAPAGAAALSAQEEEDAIAIPSDEALWPAWIFAGCITEPVEPLDSSLLPD